MPTRFGIDAFVGSGSTRRDDEAVLDPREIGGEIVSHGFVDPDAEPDGAVGGLLTVVFRNLLLHLHGTAYGSVYAVEYDQQGVAACLYYPAAMLLDRRVYQGAAQRSQTYKCPRVIQSDQSAVTDHVGIERDDQLPSIRRPGGRF